MYARQQAIAQMNTWGAQQVPFLFIIDFELKNTRLYPLDAIPAQVHFSIGATTNTRPAQSLPPRFELTPHPIDFAAYQKKFSTVMEALRYGNTYLLNLTCTTPLQTNLRLLDIYHHSQAPYKLCIENQFVVFSPEPFVKIQEGVIASYPMKGTLDARVPKAREKLLQDPKEQAEHATIVDLIRNDLSRVARQVRVTKYRYLQTIYTHSKPLLQASSEISGQLPHTYMQHLGDILFALLPAGSVSGAPKPKTITLIRQAEKEPRGYFTGIAGVFDGQNLDSGVLIRFIEQKNNQLYFRSGGGITAQSNALAEYREMLDKVYVPFS